MDQQIETGLSILRRGGLVGYPTDTVYGLGSDATNVGGVRRIFAVKNRPATKPLPVLVADIEMLRRVVPTIDDGTLASLSQFMPGALTIVGRAAAWLPKDVTAGSLTVGVRIPDHPLALQLCAGLNQPLIGTSANISGLPSPLNATEAKQQLGNTVDYFIEGICTGGVESTVLDLSPNQPKIIREGAISAEVILTALGQTSQPTNGS